MEPRQFLSIEDVGTLASPGVSGAEEFVPAHANLDDLRKAAQACRRCDLYKGATQAVFGDGDADARIVFIGEMPGNSEDKEGVPFVGPAGGLLARAMDDVGIDRSTSYLTNVVKHFKFVRAARGKRRLHQTPSRTEVVACRPWLAAEMRLLRPEIVVLLGATAAKAVLGTSFKISERRGELFPMPDLDDGLTSGEPPPWAMATVHPSAVLRADDRASMYAGLVADMQTAAEVLNWQGSIPRD